MFRWQTFCLACFNGICAIVKTRFIEEEEVNLFFSPVQQLRPAMWHSNLFSVVFAFMTLFCSNSAFATNYYQYYYWTRLLGLPHSYTFLQLLKLLTELKTLILAVQRQKSEIYRLLSYHIDLTNVSTDLCSYIYRYVNC